MKKNYFYLLAAICFLTINGLAQAPVINPISGPVNVCFDPNASAVFNVSASNSPVAYFWSVSPSTNVQIQTTYSSTVAISFGNVNGTYTVYCFATNASGSSAMDSFVVNVFEKPNVTFSGNLVFCQGSSTNLSASPTIIPASSTLNSGSSTLFYTWSPPTGLDTTSGPNVTADPNVTTVYTVSVQNGFCTSTAQITVFVSASATIYLVSNKNPICTGETTLLNASGALTFTWNTGAFGDTTSVSPVSTTVYTVTGKDANNCTASVAITQSVSLCTSINERQLYGLDQVRIYPNPSAGTLNIDLGVINGEEVQVRITNVTGQSVLDGKTSASLSVYDISWLKSGVYFIVVKQAQNIKSLKLIKE